ncbi:ATPase domain protein [Escherichia coli DEC2C]|nr:ATPase domain protein [Escherichia coli DEC2C]
MLAPADQPPDDILDYVVVDTDKQDKFMSEWWKEKNTFVPSRII